VTTLGFDVRDNTQIGELLLRNATGETLLFPIRVGSGLETATSSRRSSTAIIRPGLPHLEPDDLGHKYRVHNYVCRLEFPRPFQPVEMEFRNDFNLKLAILGVALKQVDTGRFTLALKANSTNLQQQHRSAPRLVGASGPGRASEPTLLDLMTQNRLPDGAPIDYRKLALIERNPLFPLEPSYFRKEKRGICPMEPDISYSTWRVTRRACSCFRK
jgi:hypothetical protein